MVQSHALSILSALRERMTAATESDYQPIVKRKKINDLVLIPDEDAPIVSAIRPHMRDGPWVAGGACISWLSGQPVTNNSDIDVFFKNKHQIDCVMKRLSEEFNAYRPIIETPNAMTFEIKDSRYSRSHLVQLITFKLFEDVEELFNHFDISVCKIATDGNAWKFGENTMHDFNNRILRMDLPLKPDALRRLTKYWTYGYEPTSELFEEIFAATNLNTKFKEDGEYNNAF